MSTRPAVRASLRLLSRAVVRRVRHGGRSVALPALRPGQALPEALDTSDPALAAAFDRVAARLDSARRSLHVPGLSAAIVYNQDIIWTGGFGLARLDREIPADQHTIYHQGSIAKIFTNTMLMQLRDAGMVSLDDPIARYIPEVDKQSNDLGRLTLRQLASHTSGLPMEAPLDYIKSTHFPSIDTVLASLSDVQLVAPPMKEFKYSNLGFALLGHALERAAGQSYKEYVTERILQPLGMVGSVFDPVADQDDRVAVGYLPVQGNDPPASGRMFDAGAFVPAGAVWASVADMARFVSLQFWEGPAEENQILSVTSVREMHAPIMFIDPQWQAAIALGGALERVGIWGGMHAAGGVESFAAMIAYLPDLKLGMALAMNTGVNPGPLVEGALQELIPIVTETLARHQLAQATADPAVLQRYAGHYSWPGVSELDVRGQDGVLLMKTQLSDSEFIASPVAEHAFRMEGGRLKGEVATFEVDDSGRATRLWIGNYPMDRVNG